MNGSKLLLGGVAAVAALGIAFWLLRAPPESTPAESTVAPAAETSPAAPPAAQPTPKPVEPRAPARKPTATDPRLAALLGAPGDALVEYKTAPDGRVIQEIDLDPNSQGYLKPMREYQYAGDQLAVVTVYKYLGTQLQVTRATASYRADGSVDRYDESTEYRKP